MDPSSHQLLPSLWKSRYFSLHGYGHLPCNNNCTLQQQLARARMLLSASMPFSIPLMNPRIFPMLIMSVSLLALMD